MARYIVCEKCNELIEYKPETKYEGGMSYVTLICPLCGYRKDISTNHVHYGNDGKK